MMARPRLMRGSALVRNKVSAAAKAKAKIATSNSPSFHTIIPFVTFIVAQPYVPSAGVAYLTF